MHTLHCITLGYKVRVLRVRERVCRACGATSGSQLCACCQWGMLQQRSLVFELQSTQDFTLGNKMTSSLYSLILFLFRKLQETQMSTTSKLEEAEHKVQSLQTGVVFFILS